MHWPLPKLNLIYLSSKLGPKMRLIYFYNEMKSNRAYLSKAKP